MKCDELTTRGHGELCSRDATMTVIDRISQEPRFYCTMHGKPYNRKVTARLLTDDEKKGRGWSSC